MNLRSRSGFTIVEMLIVVVVLAILVGISVVGYNGVRVAAFDTAAKAELRNAATAMQLAYQETGTYPSTIPKTGGQSGPGTGTGSGAGSGTGAESGNGTGAGSTSAGATTLTVKWSGTVTTYGTLTDVQNGVLLSNICQDLIDEGFGKAPNQGGQVQTYITGCGNWNNGSMQVTAWNTRVWNTPVSSAQLLEYANTFTSSDTWNASQVTVVKNFYTELVKRHTDTGGIFPVKSFWDSWAAPGNGGVQKQALPANPTTKTGYCVEATMGSSSSKVWHIDETGTIKEGPC